MWVIFRDPKTPFLHLDKYVFALVEDTDIATYHAGLLARVGGRTHDIDPDVFFLQQFVSSADDVEFYARRFTVCRETIQ
jgi:hypothetical protein